jgi:hypothetical protein
MVAGWLAKEARPMIDSAALRVRSPIIEPAQAGMGDGASAHRAGFKRYIEIASDEPFGTELGRGLADDDHFCVSGWIAEFAGAISSARDHFPVTNKRGPDRRFAAELGRPRFGESEAHRIVFVLSGQIHASHAALPFWLFAKRFSLAATAFGLRTSGRTRQRGRARGRNKAI